MTAVALTDAQVDNISTVIFNNLKNAIQQNFPQLQRRDAGRIVDAVRNKFLTDLQTGDY